MQRGEIREVKEVGGRTLGVLWLVCPYPVLARGLAAILFDHALVRVGGTVPEGEAPRCVLVCATDVEETRERVRRVRASAPEVPTVVFGLSQNLPIVRAALREGARGFVHGEMEPSQIVRALTFAAEGEIVVPRNLLKDLFSEDDSVNLEDLTQRQLEILRYVADGMTNSQIGAKLFLSESTIKQHLRSAYKTLKVSNRTEAARLVRGRI